MSRSITELFSSLNFYFSRTWWILLQWGYPAGVCQGHDGAIIANSSKISTPGARLLLCERILDRFGVLQGFLGIISEEQIKVFYLWWFLYWIHRQILPSTPWDRYVHPIGAKALRYRFEKNMLTRYRIVSLWVHYRLIRRTAGLFSEPYRAYRESRFFICVFKIIEITDSKGASFSKLCCCCGYSTFTVEDPAGVVRRHDGLITGTCVQSV